MKPACRRRGPTAVLILAGVMLLELSNSGNAQPVDCDRLRRRISSLDGGGGNGQAARYARSARRQQGEIDRTLAYRRSLGCDRRQFLVFGDPPPPDCARIDAQIERMNNNLADLQQSAARFAQDDPDERSELVQRYEVYCRRPGDWAAAERRGFPDDEPPGSDYRRVPLEPEGADAPAQDAARDEAPPPEPDAGADTTVGGAKAVCVKICDGSFFPVSYSASRASFASLEALCHASCPNVETRLYTYDIDTEIAQAVDKEGKAYSELPNANRYVKAYDESCSCRAPGKTWVQTLAEAERLYASGKHDIVVTQEMSDALARAAPPAALKPGSKNGSRLRKAAAKSIPALISPTRTPAETAQVGPEPGASAAVRDANGTTSGVDLRGTGEAAPAGVPPKRRVRVIAPNL